MKIKLSISEINKARKIVFSITIVDTTTISIDKDKIMIQVNGRDATDICMDMLRKSEPNQDYTGGLVSAKILTGTTDDLCISFINSVADEGSIILEP